MKNFKTFLDEALAFPVIVVVNRKAVAVAGNPQQMAAVKKKYPQSSRDNVEFMTHVKWKKDYGFSRSSVEDVDRMLRHSK